MDCARAVSSRQWLTSCCIRSLMREISALMKTDLSSHPAIEPVMRQAIAIPVITVRASWWQAPGALPALFPT